MISMLFPDHEISTINDINSQFREMISNKILLYHPNILNKGIKRIVRKGLHRLICLRQRRFFIFWITFSFSQSFPNEIHSPMCFLWQIIGFLFRTATMPPWKETEVTSEGSGQSSEVISDTSPRSINIVKTWTHVFNTIQYEVVNCPDDSSDNENANLSTKYKIIAQAELHKIATRSMLLPYTDMIRWALDNVDIPTQTIFNS